MELEIANLNELNKIIGRTYWIDSRMESKQWAAYLEVSENKRDLIFKLSKHSQYSKEYLEEISEKLGLKVDDALKCVKNKEFDFEKMSEGEIFSEILKCLNLSKDLLKRLYSHTSKNLITRNWKDNEQEYYKRLKQLIQEKDEQIKLIEPYTEKFERVI